MDNIMIPQESSNEANDFSQNNTITDDMTLDPVMRLPRRRAGSSRGLNEESPSLNRIRKNRKDDKIPFTPEVR